MSLCVQCRESSLVLQSFLVHQLRRSETGIKGIIDLSLRASFAELAVSLRSVSVPIAKLCVSGE